MLRRFALLTLVQVVVISSAGKGNGEKFRRSIEDGFRRYFKDHDCVKIIVKYDRGLESYNHIPDAILSFEYKNSGQSALRKAVYRALEEENLRKKLKNGKCPITIKVGCEQWPKKQKDEKGVWCYYHTN